MLGPVYTLELLNANRRIHRYPWRGFYVIVLLIEAQWLTIGLWDFLFASDGVRDLIYIADRLLRLIALQQGLAIIGLAPAFAAGSISDERQRGTLDFLLTTPLSDAEIVVGKWLAQATQVLHLISPGYLFIALLGGILGERADGIFLVIVEQIVLLYAIVPLALSVSSVSRTTPKAMVGVYAALGAIVCTEALEAPPILTPALWSYSARMELTPGQHAMSIASLLIVMLMALGLTIWRLRPAHERQRDGTKLIGIRWWDRPPIGDAPMRWKERFCGDWFSVPLWRGLQRWAKCGLLAGIVALVGIAWPTLETFLVMAVLQLTLCTLFVGLRAAGAITGERENGTWESLLTTHLDAYQIVRGKLWGQIDAVRPYLLCYLVPALLTALWSGGWEILWIPYLWLASWVTLYHLGAIGIGCSIKAPSTWQSIVLTLTTFVGSVVSSAMAVGVLISLLTICMLTIVVLPCAFGFAAPLAAGTVSLIFLSSSLPTLVGIFADSEVKLQEAQKELDAIMGRQSRQSNDER